MPPAAAARSLFIPPPHRTPRPPRERSWLAAWYACFTFDTVYIKHVLDTVKMTDWGRVYYTNSLALGLLLLAFPFVGEWSYLQYNVWTMEQARALFVQG